MNVDKLFDMMASEGFEVEDRSSHPCRYSNVTSFVFEILRRHDPEAAEQLIDFGVNWLQCQEYSVLRDEVVNIVAYASKLMTTNYELFIERRRANFEFQLLDEKFMRDLDLRSSKFSETGDVTLIEAVAKRLEQ